MSTTFDPFAGAEDTVVGLVRDPYPELHEKRAQHPVELVTEVDRGELGERDLSFGRVLHRRVEDLAARHVDVAVVDGARPPGERQRQVGPGADDPHRLVQKRLRRATWASSAAPSVQTKIRVDDVSSESMTILDVLTQDRPGLLHTIADALHRAGVSIEVARIATEGNRATDAFYLRDLAGRLGKASGKIMDASRREAVVEAVQTAIASLAGGG